MREAGSCFTTKLTPRLRGLPRRDHKRARFCPSPTPAPRDRWKQCPQEGTAAGATLCSRRSVSPRTHSLQVRLPQLLPLLKLLIYLIRQAVSHGHPSCKGANQGLIEKGEGLSHSGDHHSVCHALRVRKLTVTCADTDTGQLALSHAVGTRGRWHHACGRAASVSWVAVEFNPIAQRSPR